MCSREFERLRRMQEAELPRKVAVVCNYHVLCNSTGNCEKCPFLLELKIVDLEKVDKVFGERGETNGVQTCPCEG
jgi:hypothetical protein